MSRRSDAGAPARLAQLSERARAWLATADEPPRSVTALLERPAPTDPALAALAEEGLVAACLADAPGFDVGRASLAAAVRTSLRRLADAHPGRLVEVRVPPYAAVQIGIPGAASVHTRGTPPNVVETDAATWLGLASGRSSWSDALTARRVTASGTNADLARLLP